VARVSIVPAAVIFDLAIGRADMRPDAAAGYAACEAAARGPPWSARRHNAEDGAQHAQHRCHGQAGQSLWQFLVDVQPTNQKLRRRAVRIVAATAEIARSGRLAGQDRGGDGPDRGCCAHGPAAAGNQQGTDAHGTGISW